MQAPDGASQWSSRCLRHDGDIRDGKHLLVLEGLSACDVWPACDVAQQACKPRLTVPRQHSVHLWGPSTCMHHQLLLVPEAVGKLDARLGERWPVGMCHMSDQTCRAVLLPHNLQENFLMVPRTAVFNTNRATEQAKYFASGTYGTDFEGVSTYAMLQLQERAAPANQTGWQYWNSLFRSLQPNKNTAATADSFATAASATAARNLVPFFTAWKWPISAGASAAIASAGYPSSDLSATAACGDECSNCCSANPLTSVGSLNGSTAFPDANYTGVLAQHNTFRAVHSSPSMAWDAGLAADADAYAAQCIWQHDPNNAAQGENLYYTSNPDPAAALADATAAW